jgi:chaperone required for assembly of F1-ATPase
VTEWKQKRFWQAASAAAHPAGYAVKLDDRPVKTPGKADFVVPSNALARAIAAEWDAQEGEIDPRTMPLTRLANSAIDKVRPQRSAIADMLAEYGGNDLLCYRAEGPAALIERQAVAWDPLLAWARDTHGVALEVQTGVMPLSQPEASLARIGALTHALDPFDLMAFHELVTISGSWVLGYAVMTQTHEAEAIWTVAHLDELWQEEQWGEDELAQAASAARRDDFLTAERFATLARDG